MTVFDQGQFAARHKQDKIKFSHTSKDWNDGFLEGYQAAIDRYISLDKKELDNNNAKGTNNIR